ncbi:MAG: hypothetical protein ACREF3_14810, partial [Acetobacteraceae bacterium]
MDQSGAVAPHDAAEINGTDPAREFVPSAPALIRLHARTGVCAEPRDMLIPERRAAPFLGRAAETAALRTWLSGPALVAVQHIVGGAGVGKTRLAIELCAWAERQGWDCGFIAAGSFPDFVLRQHSSPLLIVLDGVGLPIDAWPGDRWPGGAPLRIIVIDRDARASLEKTGMPGTAPAEVSEPLRLGDLSANDERVALLRHAMSMAASAAGVPPCLPLASTVLDRGEPLHLLMAGLIAPHADVRTALSEAPAMLAHRLAMQERWRLQRLAPALGLDPCLLWHIAACVTLQSGCPLDMAGELVQEEASALAFHLPASCDEVADVIADA